MLGPTATFRIERPPPPGKLGRLMLLGMLAAITAWLCDLGGLLLPVTNDRASEAHIDNKSLMAMVEGRPHQVRHGPGSSSPNPCPGRSLVLVVL